MRYTNTMHRYTVGLMSVVLLVGLAGCAPTSEQTASSGVPTASTEGRVAVAGPYAAEFAEVARIAKSETVRSILAKGMITEQDRATVWEHYRSCAAAGGYTVTEDKDGTRNFEPKDGKNDPAKLDAVNVQCEEESSLGMLDALYEEALKYPKGESQKTEMIVDCLRRAKVVPKNYSVADFTRDERPGGAWRSENHSAHPVSKSGGEPDKFEAYMRCSSDPTR